MFVNVSGSLAIGFIAALGPIKLWEQLLMIGLLGGYTTFSSFSLQTLQLMHEGRWTVAFTNAFGSLALCLVGFGSDTSPGAFSAADPASNRYTRPFGTARF
jgi:CrcB protein